MVLNGFPDVGRIGSKQYNIGDKPTVTGGIRYTYYIDQHAWIAANSETATNLQSLNEQQVPFIVKIKFVHTPVHCMQ